MVIKSTRFISINMERKFLSKTQKTIVWARVGFVFVYAFWERILLCSSGWPGAQYVDQAVLKLLEIYLPIHARIKGTGCHRRDGILGRQQHRTMVDKHISPGGLLLGEGGRRGRAGMSSVEALALREDVRGVSMAFPRLVTLGSKWGQYLQNSIFFCFQHYT